MNNVKNKLLSIIVPIYNGERYLAECLDSMDMFDKEKVEILLIDDGDLLMIQRIFVRAISPTNQIFTIIKKRIVVFLTHVMLV